MATKILIDYSIEFLTPFHSGTGLSSGLVDRTIRRDSEGFLIVPASTIKGIIRDNVQKILKICKHLDFFEEKFVNVHDKDDFLNLFRRPSSIIDRIFGSPRCEGTLNFYDLKLTENIQNIVSEEYDKFTKPITQKELENISEADNKFKMPIHYLQSHQRTQIKIMRKTKTAASGALFNSEFGNAELKFNGKISGYLKGIKVTLASIKDLNYELVILLCALKMIDRICGNKSIGMGQFSLQINDIKINDQSYKLEQVLNSDMLFSLQNFFKDEKEEYKDED